jgi:DNA-3-methyladenine glycosylase
MPRAKKLKRSFYNRPTLTVAEELVGKYFVCVQSGRRVSGKIVEVEAYIGEDDPACHAAPGPTKRNAVMYGPAGYAYIYFIYGMYNCLNVVTEKKGFPAAVLIRAAEPEDGIEMMTTHSPKTPPRLLLSGPGRLCRSMGLTARQSGKDLCGDTLYIEDRGESAVAIVRTPRVGIRKGTDRLWRFVDLLSVANSARKVAGGSSK